MLEKREKETKIRQFRDTANIGQNKTKTTTTTNDKKTSKQKQTNTEPDKNPETN